MFFKGERGARKSLKAFFSQLKLELNIIRNVFFLFAVRLFKVL